MSDSQNNNDQSSLNVLALLRDHGRRAAVVAGVVAASAAVVFGVYLVWGQPVRRSSVLEFRPTFHGAADGQYPNGLPFGPSDVAAPSILDLVYDTNSLGDYCSREAFRAGVFVEQRSAQSVLLDAEYLSLLSTAGITQVERQRLQAEYEAKRAALPVQYRLVFVNPRPCANIPQVVITKLLADVLTTWASESETKRGVLKHQTEVLTPSMLDVGLGLESSRLLRADLIRTALWRIVASVDAVEKVPGAALIRLGDERLTFMEVRNKLVDLVRSRLEPLVASAGQSMVRESLTWVTETVASAEREQQSAEGRAEANREALRLYSGMTQTPSAPRPLGAQSNTGASDVQTLSPQIDSTFIDRIIEMSSANTTFRQELTTSMVEATVEAVAAKERAAYYRRLLETLRGPVAQQMSVAEVDERLSAIVDQGKELTRLFNELYNEFSRVSLRAAAAMYQTEKPVTTEVSRNFTPRDLLLLVFGAFLTAFLLAFGYFILRDRLTAAAQTR